MAACSCLNVAPTLVHPVIPCINGLRFLLQANPIRAGSSGKLPVLFLFRRSVARSRTFISKTQAPHYFRTRSFVRSVLAVSLRSSRPSVRRSVGLNQPCRLNRARKFDLGTIFIRTSVDRVTRRIFEAALLFRRSLPSLPFSSAGRHCLDRPRQGFQSVALGRVGTSPEINSNLPLIHR